VLLTLLVEDRLLPLALGFGLPLVGDLAGRGAAGQVKLVDVVGGLTEGRRGGVRAGVAVGGTHQRRQVQGGFAPRDDGDVERKLAPAVGRRRLADGERRRGGELAAGARRRGRLAEQEFVVLAAGEEKLQRTAEEKRKGEHQEERLSRTESIALGGRVWGSSFPVTCRQERGNNV